MTLLDNYKRSTGVLQSVLKCVLQCVLQCALPGVAGSCSVLHCVARPSR